MIEYPNCKINLGLRVIEKRIDGFHNIETVFYPIDLCDILEITKSDKISLQSSGIVIDGEMNENICMKAYNLLYKEFHLPPVSIYIHKLIPLGAGLGGGSSDTAYTIKLLNNLFALHLSDNKMEYFASKIGSDCAFFIQNKAVFASGRGDIFSEIKLSLRDYHILIIKPDIHINTKMAYGLLNVSHLENVKQFTSLKEIVEKPISAWKDELVNDFEKPIFSKYPQLKEIKERLYNEGAVYASMTGSGSAIYGIFENEANKEAFKDFRFVYNSTLIY